VHTTRHGKLVHLRVAVTAAGVRPVRGAVVVRDGAKVVARLHLVKGRDTATFHLRRRGVHHLTASYLGSVKAMPLSRTWNVRIR
jgi:hypothetical protein